MESSQSGIGVQGRMSRSQSASAAGLGLRCAAFLIDYILTTLVLTLTLVSAAWIKRSWMAPEPANFIVTMGYLGTAGLIFYNWVYLFVQGGRSLGKNFIGLRVVRNDGANLDYKTALLRHIIGYPISFLCLGLGILWILVDSRQQGWHDKLAGTTVVRD